MENIELKIADLERLRSDCDKRAEQARKKVEGVTFNRFSCSMMAKTKLEEIQQYQEEEQKAREESMALQEQIVQMANEEKGDN